MTYYDDTATGGWLRYLISKGLIPDGHIDERSITDITAGDLSGYTQVHLFAGIGGWARALRLAGFPDLPCWTASLPCPSFSTVGKGRGFDDPRGQLLYPFLRLVGECRPAILLGEQVENAVAHGWLDTLFLPLEREGYACGAAILPAAGVGSPHLRHRIFWGARRLADAGSPRPGFGEGDAYALGRGQGGGVGYPTGARLRDGHGSTGEPLGEPASGGRPTDTGIGRMDDAGLRGLVEPLACDGGIPLQGPAGDVQACRVGDPAGVGPCGGGEDGRGLEPEMPREGLESGFWDDVEWLPCRDGKYRPIEPGLMPVAHGVPDRVELIKGYGNAIVPQAAAVFIEELLEASGHT